MEETRKSYHTELEELRSLVVRLGASVIEAIPRATNVLLSGDLEGADYLVQSDDEIDARTQFLKFGVIRLSGLFHGLYGTRR